MKKYNLFLFLFASIYINAQTYTLSGKVVDANQKPLVGASIFLTQLKKGILTDFEGKFQLNLSKGEYKIEISYVGFKTKSLNQIVNNDKNITIELLIENNILDEVLVTAVRVEADAPITHSNLSKKEISTRNLGQDIPVLMNYLPSVTTSSDAGAGIGYTYIRVRGSDASRINVTINGIPYNDAESQGTFWVNMGDFASSTQSLQLQRGVGTSTNGSGAFGASLNILTDATSKESNGEVSNSFGSYKTRKHTVKFSTGKINNHFEFAGRLSNIYSDGYVDRAFADLKSYFLQGSYTHKDRLIKALVFGGKEKTYQSWYGLSIDQLKENRRQNPYTYDNETDNYWQDHYQLHWNEKLSNRWSINLGLNYTKGKGYFEQFKKNGSASDFNNLIEDQSDLIVRRWLDNDFYVINFNGKYNHNNIQIVSGFSYSNYTNDHFGEVIWGNNLAPSTNIRDRYYYSDAKKNDVSIFSKININLTNRIKTFVDFQGRFINYQTQGLTSGRRPINVEAQFHFFNPKIGFTYTLNNTNSLYVSYAKASREPNRDDYKNGENVLPEVVNDFELGWRLKNNAIRLYANIYYMLYKNQLVQTGGLNDVGEYLRKNVDNSHRLGLEVDTDIKISKHISINQNFTLSSNKITNFILERDGVTKNIGTTNIAFSPNIIMGNRIIYQPVDNLEFSLLSKFVGHQYLSNTDTQKSKLDDYFVSDFSFNYAFKANSIFNSIIFKLLVNNILNRKYVDRGYTYLDTWTGPTSFEVQGYYPQATRNFIAGITFGF